MATHKSTGSKPGAERARSSASSPPDPPPATAADLAAAAGEAGLQPTVEKVISLLEEIAAVASAGIAAVRAAASVESASPAPTARATPLPAETDPDDDDEDVEADDRYNHEVGEDYEEEPPTPRDLIESERSRLMTADSVLACAQIALDPMQIIGAPEPCIQDVVAVARRLVNKAVSKLDSRKLRQFYDESEPAAVTAMESKTPLPASGS